MSLPSSSSFILPTKEYDVFLSFRGTNTRKTFTDHLYHALERSGIVTFRDDPRLKTGKEITPELLKAIQQSQCFVIILSENYASSSWCLEELAEIVKLKEQEGLEVFPIFYHVDPSYFRRHKGKVGDDFAKHEKRCEEEDKHKIQKWRDALTQVTNISGKHLKNDEHEGKFIGAIVKEISAKLCKKYPIVHDGLVGISSRLKELNSKIQAGEDDVRIVGIWGMGCIRKTTLARVFYDRMSPDFEGKSFIADVREVSNKDGLVSLQKQLLSQILNEEGFNLFNVHDGKNIISRRLSCKKVLIVLDDVDNLQQLECLVGRRDWFGSGSRIIVTTRDEHLLQCPRADDVYKPTTLNDDDALRLFNSKAFGNDTMPNDDSMELSERVVRYAGGLPLALKVLGSFLCGRNEEAQWTSAIERLKRESNKDIIDVLRISFDGLGESEKNIFLDIACFFIGWKKFFVMNVLDGCEFSAGIGIDVLVKKSLVTVDKDNMLGMHDLLKEMGRMIVTEKSMKEPGKRCRLWDRRYVDHVLTQNTATDKIEGLVITHDQRVSNEMLHLNGNAFSKMVNLRLLRVICSTNCDHLDFLPNGLRLLDWDFCPLESLPSSFRPNNLVALLLRSSRIKQLWKGTLRIDKLKEIDLTQSRNLTETPDLRMAPNVEVLNFYGCTSLVDVHPSIGELKSIKLLNLRGCKSLRSLPPITGMISLEKLDLTHCSNLEGFPEIDGKMERLLKLNLNGIGIKELIQLEISTGLFRWIWAVAITLLAFQRA